MAKETAPADTVLFPPAVTNGIIKCADLAFALWPQPKPSKAAVQSICMIGHRGCKDVKGIKENTFAAFDYALAQGMQGVEIDLRWTKDQQLVLAHDPDLQRIYGRSGLIINLTLAELRAEHPEIPTLAETIERYRGKLRFFIEIKKDDWDQLAAQQAILMKSLAGLTPAKDFFLMSFDLALLARFDAVTPDAKIAIAHSKPSQVRDYVAAGKAKTLGGHLVVMNKAFRQFCAQHQVAMALGFPASANSLYREIKLGAAYILVDDPQKARQWLNAC